MLSIIFIWHNQPYTTYFSEYRYIRLRKVRVCYDQNDIITALLVLLTLNFASLFYLHFHDNASYPGFAVREVSPVCIHCA